ncbi:ABC-three component system protein [Chryseobacterium sp. SIMBA_028]|uniref:ABC-three component system protein n=1 Tax=Chryseobacterium sp. SIMBA_028 TaxID=3085771 RepID=UPI003978C2B4
MTNNPSIFSASEPNLGYLYQIRYGLMLIISEPNDEAKLLIEKIDDISIDSLNSLDVYQTKFHVNSVANLTNASVDLWKTIRVWSEGIKNGSFNIDNSIFNLVTTATASNGTIPFKLKQGTQSIRDVDKIVDDLSQIARTSTNTINSKAYTSFLSLTVEQQKGLVEKIIVTDASVDINEAKTKILHELRNSTLKKDALYERLEGWFLSEVILQLQNLRAEITAKEVRLKVIDVADTLKFDNLPNDFDASITADANQLNIYRGFTFVKQLELVTVNPRSINHAISDYHRAFSQKSKWLREGLINPTDDIIYENKLKEDWDKKFSIIINPADDEETQKRVGKIFYESHYVNQCPQIFIKDRFRENYMITGCCHMISDKKEIGWHPNFENKIN